MTQAAPRPDPIRASRPSSPGLAQFRKSPFRLLRLAASATAEQAVWQCDKALARARVGMALPDPDPVPWLAPGDEVEIQEAAQTMESPLARLVEQLLWFDRAGDPDGPALLEALAAGDAARLTAYLGATSATPTIARELDEANLRLLLGFSALREVGPRFAAAASGAAQPIAWRSRDGLSVVEDPHKVIGAAPAAARWASLLGEAMTAWGALLARPAFVEHVHAKIAALGDPLLTADDFDAVASALRARLADLIVGETKLEMAEGRIAAVAQLSAIAGASGIDAETWLVAFRPLKAQFRAELADLMPEAETGRGVIEDVSAYLDRLATLTERWRVLDEAQLLGLGQLIDEAVSEAFGRLRGLSRAEHLEPRFKEVLARIAKLAVSSSVVERVRGYEDRLVDMAKAMCHFCGKRELDAAWCGSVSSQKEVSRQTYGNSTQIQYQLAARPVARCERCAKLHGFIRSAGTITLITIAGWIALVAIFHPHGWFSSLDGGAIAGLLMLGAIVAATSWYVARRVAARVVIGAGGRDYRDYETCNAYTSLRGDGYYEIRYDGRPNAWELVNKEGVKRRTDSNEALKAFGYIAVFALIAALRICGGR